MGQDSEFFRVSPRDEGLNILDALYFNGKLSEVVKALATFPTAYNLSKKELYEKVLEDLKNGIAADINGDLFEAYGNNLRRAIDGVFKGGDEYSDITLQLQANVSRFAAYKAYQATKELNGIEADEIDSRGKAILNKYNRWQAAEYNTAMSRARTARQYHDFTSDPISNELYPNLKWLPSRSATPREAHMLFWNRVWAKNDPFWNENTPGSLWNCKCDWEETDEPVTNGNPGGNVSARGLEGNPAKTGEIFTDECPYVKNSDREVEHQVLKTLWKSNFNWALENVRGKAVKNKSVDEEITLSRRGIKEFLNQNHDEYIIKNEMIRSIRDILENAEYMGETHYAGKVSKIFKTQIKGKDNFIIVNRDIDNNLFLHSITESEKVLTGINK